MRVSSPFGRVRKLVLASSRRRTKPLRPRLEFLEDRTMLDAASIVVGRVLSDAFVGQVKNRQETITYTVYNEQATPETGVLLTTTLQPGVTMASASQAPDQSGQNLAWSLGTINGYDRASVTVTVNLPSTTPTQIDEGAHVYATLNANAVSNSTPVATLRAGNVPLDANGNSLIAPPLDPKDPLAAGSDANDPFIQEEAAKLDYDPTRIFAFLHNQIGYASYLGSVRGARGTLWSNAGNALDVANLGAALYRASGIPAQYVQGTLARPDASRLILKMFANENRTVGVSPVTAVSDPGNDPQLLAETESHYWLRFDAGQGWTDADPLMPGATIGQAFTASTGSFSTIPQSLRETTTVRLDAEFVGQASALFGLGGPSTTTVIDQTFNDAELAGRPLTIGTNVSSSSGGFIFTTKTNNYSPYLMIGDEAYSPDRDVFISGTNYQEVQSNFPFSSNTLTGVFLNVTASGPQGAAQTYTRALVDRIGYAARQGSGGIASFASSGAPALSNFDAFTLNVTSAADPKPNAALMSRVRTDAAAIGSATPDDKGAIAATPLLRDFNLETSRLLSDNFLNLSRLHTDLLQRTSNVVAYYARPRVVLGSIRLQTSPATASSPATTGFRDSIDILNDSLRVEVAPGRPTIAGFLFNLSRGMFENLIERDTVAVLAPAGTSPVVDNTFDVFKAAAAQGVGLVEIGPANLSLLDSLSIPADAKARITTDVQQGFGVIVPRQTVVLNGKPTIAWAEINYATGEYIGVDADGGHEGLFEFMALVGEQLELQIYVIKFFSPVAGFDAGAILGVAAQLALASGGDEEKVKEAIQEAKKETKEEFEQTIQVTEAIAKTLALGELSFEKAKDSDIAAIFSKIQGSIKGGENAFNEAIDATLKALAGFDPKITALPIDPSPISAFSANRSSGSETVAPIFSGGTTIASILPTSASIAGISRASWSSSATNAFQIGGLVVSSGTVSNPAGQSLGSGSIAVTTTSTYDAAIAGKNAYDVKGNGSLSFYGPAESTLGVSGTWQNYSANITGNVSIVVTVPAGVLTLNGQTLPAGTYTITTNAATLTGSGNTSSPNFAGSATIDATGATVDLGRGGGNVSVGGKPIDATNGITLTGYTGAIAVNANGNGTDAVKLDGNASNILSVSASQNTFTTDQNTPITFKANVNSSFGDTYNLTAQAPSGWTVTIDANGNITATPAPGLQSGTYPIDITAQSTKNPDLVAQAIVEVTIKPTTPGISLSVASDPIFTVPYNGAQLPSAFRATIRNQGPSGDSFNLTFSNVPSGFNVLNSGTSLTIPAGQTGIVGLYLVPNSGPLPAPGTVVSFKVVATSTTNPTVTQTQTGSFTVPAIDAVGLKAGSSQLSTTPGKAATTTLILHNDGNVAETVALTSALPKGLAASGLSTVSLAVGETKTIAVGLTPDSTVPLNSLQTATITATYGASTNTQTATAFLSLNVRSQQVVAADQASNEANLAGNDQLSTNLSGIAEALAAIQGAAPVDPRLFARLTAKLDDLSRLLSADPALAGATTSLATLQTAARNHDAAGLLAAAPTVFDSLTGLLTQEAAERFTLSMTPATLDLQPNQSQTLSLTLTDTGTDPLTLNLSTAALPANVSVQFSQTRVTLTPGQSTTVNATLTQTIQSSRVFTFQAIASATLVKHSANTVVAIRPSAADVLSVSATPNAVNPGTPVAVNASFFNTANFARTILVQTRLLDSSGKVVASLPNVGLSLSPSSSPFDKSLGSIATSGLANGLYTVKISLLTLDGEPLPGRSASAVFEIGAPVSVSTSQSATVVTPGTSTVSSTIHVVDQLQTTPAVLPNFGDIRAFYSAENTFGVPLLDGPTFVFENTSADAITNAAFTIYPGTPRADTFRIGTIKAGARAIVQPGLSNDGGTNHTFFKTTGAILDTSELGPNADSTPFEFTGTNGGYSIDSGVFTPAATKGPSIDDPKALATFLGGPGDADPRNHVFAPALVANMKGTYTAQTPPITVEVGYADSVRANPFFPSPWKGSPNTIFVGNDGTQDSGAVKITNIGNSSITVNDVQITVEGRKFDLWGSNVVPAGASLILAQTGGSNFDTSDEPHGGYNGGVLPFPQTFPDGETAHAAQVRITVDGIQLPTLLDTGHILTTGGSDLASRGANESQNWRPIGTTGIANPNGSNVSINVTNNLPASGYAVDPNSVAPKPTSTTGSAVTWNSIALTEGTPAPFFVSGTVSNMAPGEVRQIRVGGSVVATTYSANGQPIQFTIPLGPVVVAAKHIISMTPAIQTVDRNASATYQVTLSNPTATSQTYTLSVQGLDGFNPQLAGSVTVAPGQSTTVPLSVSVPTSESAGTFGFSVIAATAGQGQDAVEGELTVNATLDSIATGVSAGISPATLTIGQAGAGTVQVAMTNVGDRIDTYSLTAQGLPTGVSATFASPTIDVPPGLSNFRDVGLTLKAAKGTKPGTYAFQVLVASTIHPGESTLAMGTLIVTEQGVQVSLNPPSTAPGSEFQATVTNTGTTTDTFNLALGGPAALVGTLAKNSVTLAAGASQVVPIQTSAVNFAVPGSLGLTATATSTRDPNVQGAASSALTIAGFNGLNAQFQPDSQTLPAPGPTSFLLKVDNLGNLEDSYSATIIGTTGSVVANLTGLDGSATKSIRLFRLPGLASGAILLNATLKSVGEGTVTVEVQSNNDPARYALATAKVSATGLLTIVPDLVVKPSTIRPGESAALTATLPTPAGGTPPTGTITFIIDGALSPPIPLSVVNGVASATYPATNLSIGEHHVAASYSGNGVYAQSVSNIATVTVAAAPIVAPPIVTPPIVAPPIVAPPIVAPNPQIAVGPKLFAIQRFGYHAMPTTLVLFFDSPLDPVPATNVLNYGVLDPSGRLVRFASAVYDPTTRTVTLNPIERLNVHDRYLLVVNGEAPFGLTNAQGTYLDGMNQGRPGSSAIRFIDKSNLVVPPPVPADVAAFLNEPTRSSYGSPTVSIPQAVWNKAPRSRFDRVYFNPSRFEANRFGYVAQGPSPSFSPFRFSFGNRRRGRGGY